MYSARGKRAVLKTIWGLGLQFCMEVNTPVYISPDSKCPYPVLWYSDRQHLYHRPNFTIAVIAISVSCSKIFHSKAVSLLLLHQNKQGKYVVREHTSKTVNPILFTMAEWTVEILFRGEKSHDWHWLRLQ